MAEFTLSSFFPSNIFYALSTDNNLAILIFSVLFGLSLGFVSAEKSKTLVNLLDALFEAFMKLVDGALYFLPFALLSIMADQFARSGSQLITLFALKRPRWRSPIFIVPFLKLGASVSPLDELPTTPSTY